MKNQVLFSHKSDNWKTPLILYDYMVKKLHYIDLFEYCSSYDQYEKMYVNCKLFINPPYSHLNTVKFLDYITDLLARNNTVALLIPARTDTKAFEFFVKYSYHIYFFVGRLHFNDSKSAPFPSCLLLMSVKLPTSSALCSWITLDNFVKR